ncbi:GNAT family N-acetyltransferase [Chitinophaga japonensis]|uniref:L-amino acid N-acyltransferase YncA n=1 Tax=Chitinophaga japonensis TaxID=104662 RepID=A0A562T4T8_CHIJA|nr:GNAT family N-acetyltransferase [Chitinophaga japonensis]TWI88557.1 L-amino acid N-acyltransferase YncA [Chitinophaga japonensis]
MELHIKDATTADIPLIQTLVEKIWRPTYQAILSSEQISYMLDLMYSTASLTRQMETQQHRFLLLYEGENAIGYASYSTTDAADIYKLHKIYVDTGYQGKGVGRFFLNTVADRVKAAQARILELDVNRYNKARLFYEKLGFTITGEKDTHIGNGYEMNDYIMQKVL